MLRKYINEASLIRAIEDRDANFIKNVYRYHKDEYIALCKTVVVTAAFMRAQKINVNKYSDQSVEFWRVIAYINTVHNSPDLMDKEKCLPLIKLNLPKYYVEIIKETDHNDVDILDNFIPLWVKPINLIRFQIIFLSCVISMYGFYEANKYFEFKETTIDLYKRACNQINYLWHDTARRNAFLYLIAGASCSIICIGISISDHTKEAIYNFFDWATHQHKRDIMLEEMQENVEKIIQ